MATRRSRDGHDVEAAPEVVDESTEDEDGEPSEYDAGYWRGYREGHEAGYREGWDDAIRGDWPRRAWEALPPYRKPGPPRIPPIARSRQDLLLAAERLRRAMSGEESGRKGLGALLVDIPGAARILGVSVKEINKLLMLGRQGDPVGIRSVKIGRSLRVPTDDLKSYIERRISELDSPASADAHTESHDALVDAPTTQPTATPLTKGQR